MTGRCSTPQPAPGQRQIAPGERGWLRCELVAGHDGRHVALAAIAYGDRWWWLRWQGQFHELVQIDPCTVGCRTGHTRTCCILPDGHAGPHSFDLPPLPPPLDQPPPRPA